MELLLPITLTFIVGGFIILISRKKAMETKLASIQGDTVNAQSTAKTNSIIRWIMLTVAWGIISMFLVVYLFHYYSG
ncbi:hypothetical protein FLK61_27000 [Paenalkalicoccus suaedae]|uniref:Uncharacterized protein n=1 Tax=Paenalkalicoccus suaedae TaxID=2592382 RepID=A0A859FCU8_9BACI|nr:hypothetical protein [Paenalkalicoccus suaedae]QKS70404.1 hypothetical protein FLK61_27000 [Paenalkalicoccus suaedae]